jgi:hypothetical protein
LTSARDGSTMQPMKSLTEYQSLLQTVLAYKPTPEFTKKLLAALGLEWREEAKWSLPLKVIHDGSRYSIIDADDQVLLDGIHLFDNEVERLQRILTAANAELLRSSQSPATPLFWRQGDNPK